MVQLPEQRPAALGEPLYQPVLPQREIAVKPLAHHPRHQIAELLVTPRGRQGGPPDVIAEVKVRVLNPDRPPEAKRHGAELLPVAGHERQTSRNRGENLLEGRGRALEYRDRCDRHRGVLILVLSVDEYGVQWVQSVHDALVPRCAGPLPKGAGPNGQNSASD